LIYRRKTTQEEPLQGLPLLQVQLELTLPEQQTPPEAPIREMHDRVLNLEAGITTRIEETLREEEILE